MHCIHSAGVFERARGARDSGACLSKVGVFNTGGRDMWAMDAVQKLTSLNSAYIK